MKKAVFFILLFASLSAGAQVTDTTQRKSYWQQRVHYTIEAQLDDEKDMISSRSYRLVYYNQSPHALQELYFHLYANAFIPGSHYHDLNINNQVKVQFGKNEKQGLGTLVDSVQVNGQPVQTRLDNTILQVLLSDPLPPGDSAVVTMKFDTYFGEGGSMRRRMKMFRTFGYKHYNAVHWYPIVCVYDQSGWNTEQHLDKEYYADFGNFDVALTLPREYIVEGTGVITNEEEVLPDTLKARLALTRFREKPLNEKPSEIIARQPGQVKTWRFHAENVHNFAFSADPTYRRQVIQRANMEVVLMVREPNAGRWQQTPGFLMALLDFYERKYGAYAYPRLIIADAQDGTEYGMMAIVTGTYPGHIPLVSHEVAHQWYYGMVAGNETYRAFMDEGFAEFMTIDFLDEAFGAERDQSAPSDYVTKRLNKYSNRFARAYYGYLHTAWEGFDKPLETHSSDFNGAIGQEGGYGLIVYQKGAVMLYNLKYVLGDELFFRAMRYYFEKWKFAHPYPQDFRDAITEYTGFNLNWFFDQWMQTTKVIDYKIDKVKKAGNGQYDITFKRIGDQQMPIDFKVTAADGSSHYFHIPNQWFVKSASADSTTVLPKWYGWGKKLHPSYTARVALNSEIKTVEIDPSATLADIDRSDNYWKKGLPRFEFDHRVKNPYDWKYAHRYIRPDFWHNRYDGLQMGIHLEGSYFDNIYNWSASAWYNTGFGQYEIPAEWTDKHQRFAFHLYAKGRYIKKWRQLYLLGDVRYNAGLYKHRLGLEYTFRHRDQYNPNSTTLSVDNTLMYRGEERDRFYLDHPLLWSAGQLNNTMNVNLRHQYAGRKWRGSQVVEMRVPGMGSAFRYSWLGVQVNNYRDWTKFSLRTRLYGRLTFGEAPAESALYAGGASPEQLYDNKFARAIGLTTGGQQYLNHFQMGGGLNIRAMALNPAYYQASTASGGSLSAELDFHKLFKIKIKNSAKYLSLNTYLFADAGLMVSDKGQEWSSLLADAGVGGVVNFKFGEWLNIRPVSLRFDVPLLSTKSLDQQYLRYRYVIGLSRTF